MEGARKVVVSHRRTCMLRHGQIPRFPSRLIRCVHRLLFLHLSPRPLTTSFCFFLSNDLLYIHHAIGAAGLADAPASAHTTAANELLT